MINAKAACIATGILLPIAAAVFTLRPQLFGYVFLLITLICLERFRQGHSKALWVLPPLFLVWVNTHGTFVLGLMAIGLYYVSGLFEFHLGGLSAEPWTRKQRMQLLLTFLFSILALLVTPYGSQLAAYPIEIATSQPFNIANIQEWQPLSFGLGVGKYFLALVLVMFLVHVLLPVKYRLHEMALLLFGAYATCVHLRFILVFVMFLGPIIACILGFPGGHHVRIEIRHSASAEPGYQLHSLLARCGVSSLESEICRTSWVKGLSGGSSQLSSATSAADSACSQKYGFGRLPDLAIGLAAKGIYCWARRCLRIRWRFSRLY